MLCLNGKKTSLQQVGVFVQN